MSATVVVDVAGLLEAMEERREKLVQDLDEAIEKIRSVHLLDRTLAATGVHKKELLDHSECGCDRTPGPIRHPEQPALVAAGKTSMTAGEAVQHMSAALDQAEGSGKLPPSRAPKAGPKAKRKESKPPPSSGAPQNRRFTDEQKNAAVDLAEKLGSTRAAALQSGTSDVSLRKWRTEGYGTGKGPKASNGGPAAVVPDAEVVGPSIRCPSCRHLVVVKGDPGDPQHKRAALFEHYKTSPNCEKEQP